MARIGLRIPAMVCALACAALSTAGAARAQEAFTPLATRAAHVAILDYETGVLLFGKEPDTPMPPASMSKLMTLLLVFEQLKSGALSLDDEFTTSVDAWRRGGLPSGSSAMCLEPGVRATVEELIRGVIILSGNDASIVLAEAIAGSEAAFADMMSARAQELGFEGAQFANATGWPDPGQRISARALAQLARLIIREHADLYEIFSEETYDYCTAAPSNRFNRNPLLGSFEGADGLKTGRTRESGYGLVGAAARGDTRRIIVFNGMDSEGARAREAERLMRSAFVDFRIHRLFEPGDVVGSVPLFMATENTLPVFVSQAVTVGYHRRAARRADVRIRFEGPLQAPIKAGDVVGEIIIAIPGADAQVHEVKAAADVVRLGWRERALAALFHLIRTAGTEEAPAADG